MVSAWNQNIRLERLGNIESNWPHLDMIAFFNRFFLSRSQPDSSPFLILSETLPGWFKLDPVRRRATSDLTGSIRWLARGFASTTSQPLLSIRDETLLIGTMGNPWSPNRLINGERTQARLARATCDEQICREISTKPTAQGDTWHHRFIQPRFWSIFTPSRWETETHPTLLQLNQKLTGYSETWRQTRGFKYFFPILVLSKRFPSYSSLLFFVDLDGLS